MIRLGVCTQGTNAPAVAAAGFDYLEIGFSRMNELSEEEFRRMKETVLSSGIRCEAGNGFLPATPSLLGEDADPVATRDFMRRGFERFLSVGGKVVVFGSGKARRRPDGMSRDEALDRFAAVCAAAAELASEYGLRIAIEPLRAEECNYLNYVGDAFEVVRRAGFPPALGAHADLYHMAAGGDAIANLAPVSLRLYHCHIAEPGSRTVCRHGEFDGVYAELFRTLKAIGYTGRVSFEGGGFSTEGAGELFRCLNDFRK